MLKQYGRCFNHLEDLVFFYEFTGAKQVLYHINDIIDNSSSLRLKWDGGNQIYWGREDSRLIFSTHNSWSKNVKCYSDVEIYNFIMSTGNIITHEQYKERENYAKTFSNLYNIFDKSTPKDFRGFIYGDALYLSPPPTSENNIYDIKPNTKSNTTYHIHRKSQLGRKIKYSTVMIACHAKFNKFASPDSDQIPLKSFDEFQNNDIIILNPYYSNKKLLIHDELLISLEENINNNENLLNNLLKPIEGVTQFKNYIYKYTNFMAKSKNLHNLDNNFINYIKNSNIHQNQQLKILNRIEKYDINQMFGIIMDIIFIKNEIIRQLDGDIPDISITNSEGWVRYYDANFGGNIKLVNRDEWIPL